MYKLPDKLSCFAPYEPLVGEYKIRLDVNESFIQVDKKIIVEAVKNVTLNRYPDPFATGTVRAFARLFNVKPELVVAGNGSDELIGVIVAALLQKGDKLLCFKPDFTMYSFYSKLYELDIIELEKGEDMTLNVDEIVKFINENDVKCVIFSNPCNPTSLAVKKADLRRLIEGVNALVVVDEAYIDFWDERESLLSDVENYSNLIVLRTCSKSVALAGIRLGFAVANLTIIDVLKTVKSPFNVNVITQEIGKIILSDSENYHNSIAKIKAATARLYADLTNLKMFEKIFDTSTNFVFIKTKNAEKIYQFLLEKSIAVRCFGEYLRICTGTDDENKKLISELEKFKGEMYEKSGN
ncbi:MAG: histidinol-phosphate transaminase [Oscillospiraceae bacterium]|nr:histidinol-phosphate transaminase [Oscillospiraceae bacterium]